MKKNVERGEKGNITISDSVTDIGYQAFDGCDSLTDVYYAGSMFEWRAVSIDEKNEALENAKIHYNSQQNI